MPTTAYALNSRERGTEGKATIQIREASSATFKSGEIVGVSAAGQVKQLPAGTVDTTTAECANGLVRALRDASGTANTLIDCELFDDTSRVWLPISNGGAVVASNANMVGDKTAGYVTSAGANFIDAQMSADTNNTTNPLFKILKFDKKEAIGTASSIHFALCSVIQGARFGG
jgi:hypothetical protein